MANHKANVKEKRKERLISQVSISSMNGFANQILLNNFSLYL